MSESDKLMLRENLIARVACCKKGTYGIITPNNGQTEFLICGNRLKINMLWIKQGDTLWTNQSFKGNLIMRSGRKTECGEFYLGDINWMHQTSSADTFSVFKMLRKVSNEGIFSPRSTRAR